MSDKAKTVREEAHIWRARLGDGPVPTDERVAFERWIQADDRHAEAFAEAEITWRVIERDDLDEPLSAYAKTIGENIVHLAAPRVFQKPWPWIAGSIAAVLVLSLAVSVQFGLFGFNPETSAIERTVATYTTEIGDVREVSLADGSVMTLGARSDVSIELTGNRRSVRLEAGSAYFDVAHDPSRPFVVTSGTVDVMATGTAFDVQRRADRLRVAVGEGSVRISRPLMRDGRPISDGGMRESLALLPGEMVGITDLGGFEDKRELPASSVGAWRSGQLVYLRTSLEEVVADIRSFTGRAVSLDEGARDLRLSGTFDADDIDGLLDAVDAALPVRIESGEEGQLIVLDRQ
ncbi:MAG: FecR domain-containing protein [Pseudomonadota bacterium]